MQYPLLSLAALRALHAVGRLMGEELGKQLVASTSGINYNLSSVEETFE